MATKFDTRRGVYKEFVCNLRENLYIEFTVRDQDGEPYDLSEKDLVLSIRDRENSTALLEFSTGDGEITISGTGNNVVVLDQNVSASLRAKTYYLDCVNETDNDCIVDGPLICNYGGR